MNWINLSVSLKWSILKREVIWWIRHVEISSFKWYNDKMRSNQSFKEYKKTKNSIWLYLDQKHELKSVVISINRWQVYI